MAQEFTPPKLKFDYVRRDRRSARGGPLKKRAKRFAEILRKHSDTLDDTNENREVKAALKHAADMLAGKSRKSAEAPKPADTIEEGREKPGAGASASPPADNKQGEKPKDNAKKAESRITPAMQEMIDRNPGLIKELTTIAEMDIPAQARLPQMKAVIKAAEPKPTE